jgi:hypothetical protein
MRKVFGSDEGTSAGKSSARYHNNKGKHNARSPSGEEEEEASYPTPPSKNVVDIAATAMDVEYFSEQSFQEPNSQGDDDDNEGASGSALETELITDPSEGPKATADKSRTKRVACDPNGPNRSIFNNSATKQ